MILPKNGEHVVTFDCDDTLILHNVKDTTKAIVIAQKIDENEFLYHRVEPHTKHINYLKTMKERGYCVIVWSGGGQGWADAVVKALQLEKFVDIVLSKPLTYFDDKEANHWMGQRVYIPQYGETE